MQKARCRETEESLSPATSSRNPNFSPNLNPNPTLNPKIQSCQRRAQVSMWTSNQTSSRIESYPTHNETVQATSSPRPPARGQAPKAISLVHSPRIQPPRVRPLRDVHHRSARIHLALQPGRRSPSGAGPLSQKRSASCEYNL